MLSRLAFEAAKSFLRSSSVGPHADTSSRVGTGAMDDERFISTRLLDYQRQHRPIIFMSSVVHLLGFSVRRGCIEFVLPRPVSLIETRLTKSLVRVGIVLREFETAFNGQRPHFLFGLPQPGNLHRRECSFRGG